MCNPPNTNVNMLVDMDAESWNDTENDHEDEYYVSEEEEESEDEFVYYNCGISPSLFKLYNVDGEFQTYDIAEKIMIPSFLVPNSTIAHIHFPYRRLNVAKGPFDCDLDEFAKLTRDARFTSEQFYWVVGQLTIPLHRDITSIYYGDEFIRNEDAYILPKLGFSHPTQNAQTLFQPHSIDDIPYDWCQIGHYAACRAHFRVCSDYFRRLGENDENVWYYLPAKDSKNDLCVSRHGSLRFYDNEHFHETIARMFQNRLDLSA